MRTLSTLLLVSTVTAACSSAAPSPVGTNAEEDSSEVCDRDDDSQCIDWAAEAKARGFETAPDDFYRFLELACNVDGDAPPTSLRKLGEEADLIAIGRVTDVVVQMRDDEPWAPQSVALELTLDEVVKGESGTKQVNVSAICAHAGKVEGLRNSEPNSPALFILLSSPDATEPRFDFAYHYLGVVVEQPDGLSFALVGGSQQLEAPSLSEYASLKELANAL